MHTPASKKQLGSPTSSFAMDQKDCQSPEDKLCPKSSLDTSKSAGSTDKSGTGIPEETANGRSSTLLDSNNETVSLKERLAMYQAAVSKKEAASTSSTAVEESEACSLPGGLASVKKQFESQEIGSSHRTVTQFHYQHKSVQEVSSTSEVMVKSSTGAELRENVPSTHQVSFVQDEKVSLDESVHQSSLASGYENHYDETVKIITGEELPKISTQVLKQQFEKPAQEKVQVEVTPSKHIKIDHDFNQIQWPPILNTSSRTSTSRICETSSTTREVEGARYTSVSDSASARNFEGVEYFPPPPPDLLKAPSELVEPSYSPEPPTYPSKNTAPKEEYSKQRNLNELKRLYKHIHPEVRKNLEKDYFSDFTEIHHVESQGEVKGDVQQARYVFENTGHSPNKCMSPEREYLEWDEILKGEVQSMRWMFENQPLDSIKDESPDQENARNISQQEIIAGGDVKYTAWMFETQPIDALGASTPDSVEQTAKFPELARGDVRTAAWLFETQPLDTLNKIYQEDEQATDVTISKDITGGNVKTARYLFETQHLDTLGHTETIDEDHFLQLKSELEEIKGDVTTTTRLFETLPLCVIRGSAGEMLEITTVRREETERGDVRTSRWLFETQPLDMINKDATQVKVVCGVSMEDNIQGGVNRGRWLFETKTLDSIREESESSKLEKEDIIGADVRKQCWIFETQPMDSLKDNSNTRPIPTEEIVRGDVQSARYLFETIPMDALKDSPDVGKLQKVVASEEERGDVRHQKWVFESQPLENIREEKKDFIRTVKVEELDKGDVRNYKKIFETVDLSRCDESQKIQVEGVSSGSVQSNRVIFESAPLYAMQDSSGQYHEVKTVRREEIVKGDVRSCKWMFETRPIDQFDESINKFQIIKGISKQEIQSGDVKTAKWLFETQPLDSIKYFSNIDDGENKTKETDEIVKGDVKTCRWLFETQPMDVLYEKAESKSEMEEIQKGDVKTCTWLFETQALDAIKDESETVLKTCTVRQDDVQGKDVRMARFLFETENLENIKGEDGRVFKRVTEIDVQSGDVSRMKCIFENQSSDLFSSTSEETMKKLKSIQAEDIQKGNVVNCMWLFENQPIENIKENPEEHKDIRTVTDVQGGNVKNGCFIFETFSLDRIHEETSETLKQIKTVQQEEIERGDVKNYTMLFETQPLYAIQDKEGHFHEVTTVTKEEVMRGDVVGARWLFETKPLDSIKDTDEVYVLKAVTQEDIQRGDVSSARWRFETQSLDEIADDVKVLTRTVDDIQGGDVKTSKKLFESEELDEKKFVRTVSVSEIQKGDVRTATWLFETHTMDEIQGEGSDYSEIKTVTKEEVLKGDVKESIWLFEKQPLDTIKETDGTDIVVTREEIPQADVKTTTWLFETTPFHEFNESHVQKTEIVGKSIKETLNELYSHKVVDTHGILIEADEIGDVRMAKYNLMNQETPEIQKEEIIRGNLQNIMMNLLNKQDTTEKGIIIDKEERGNINTTVAQLFNRETDINVEKEEIIKGDIQEAINNLLVEDKSTKRGILIQEDEMGDVRMTIYSLLNKKDEATIKNEDIVKGNVKGTIHNLLSTPDSPELSRKIKINEVERGNVSFYTTCIESGAMDYLRQLQTDPEDTPPEQRGEEEIIGGDVEGTKLLLKKNQIQIERTVAEDDIVPGDVHNTVKVFMTEPENQLVNVQREDIIKGDLKAALNSLSQAIHQTTVIEKEEVVKGDIPATLKSLEEAKNQAKELEKLEVVPGDIKGALESLEKSVNTKIEIIVEDLVHGDIKGTLKSLEEAQHIVKEVEKEEVVKGDIQSAMQNLLGASAEKKVVQHQVSVQGDVKATIQALLEPKTPAKTQRRPSTEGDVKHTIRSLYDVQEPTQMEKETVIKGDVQGTIKSLREGKQHTSTELNTDDSKNVKGAVQTSLHSQQGIHECSVVTKSEGETVKQVPAGKNLVHNVEPENDSGKQKHISCNKSVKIKSLVQEDQSLLTKTVISNKVHQSKEKTVNEQSVKQKSASLPQPMSAMKKITTNQLTETVTAEHPDVIKKNSQRNVMRTKNIQEAKLIKHTETTVTEHKTGIQKLDVKTLKTHSRSSELGKGDGHLVKPEKKKVKPELHFPPPPLSPPPSETELPPPPPPMLVVEADNQMFPPPPPSVMKQDSDLPPPPPPPPPSVEYLHPEMEHFPPPPPPSPPSMVTNKLERETLPPPPSQKELDSIPLQKPHVSPEGAKKIIVKPANVPPLHKAPKFEPSKQVRQSKVKIKTYREPPTSTSAVLTESHVQNQQTAAAVSTITTEVESREKKIKKQEELKTQIQQDALALTAAKALPGKSLPKAPQEESPLASPKRVFVPPVKLPFPTTEPPTTKPKPYVRKFKTPLMIAEEKYRKQREETEKMKGVQTPKSPSSSEEPQEFPHSQSEKAVLVALKEQSEKKSSDQSEVIHKQTEKNIKSEAVFLNSSLSTGMPVTSVSNLTFAGNQKSFFNSATISSAKHNVTSDQIATVSSSKQKATSVSCTETLDSSNINTLIVSSAAEQLESILNTSSENERSKQEILQGLKNLTQGPSTPKSNTIKKISDSNQQEHEKISVEPSRIPKVTPSFKVKTIKVPKVDECSEEKKRGVKQQVEMKKASKQKTDEQAEHVDSKPDMNMVQEKSLLTRSSLQHSETEVKVEKVEKHNKSEIPEDSPQSKQEHQIKKLQEKSKKEKEIKQQIPIKVTVIPKDTKPLSSGKPLQVQEKGIMQKTHTTLEKEHIQVHEEVIITESTVQHTAQQHGAAHIQKQQHSYEKQKEESSKQGKVHEKIQAKEESREIPVKLTKKTMHKEDPISSRNTAAMSRKREELQQLLSHINNFEKVPGQNYSQTAKSFLENVPEWLIGQEERKELERIPDDCSVQKLKEITAYIRNQAYAKLVYFDGSLHAADNEPVSGATPKISKINIGSTKVDTQKKKEVVEEKMTWQESRKQDFHEAIAIDQRIPSPLVRLRSPSPSYITIESTARRTESPQRAAPSPPLTTMQRAATPPAPPPRSSNTPTSRMSRASATPSPPVSRAEKLAKLKDTTAKLSQGVSQSQTTPPVQVTEKKSEIIESPASFRRQFKIESHVVETATSESSLIGGTVKDMKEFYEEARKAEEHKTYNRKEPIEIPVRLGLEMEDSDQLTENQRDDVPKVDLSELVHKFESPEQKVYVRKKPIVIAERLGSDTEDDGERKTTQTEEMPAFNLKAIKTVFESTEQSCHIKDQKNKHERMESRLTSGEHTADGSKQTFPLRTQKGSKQNSPQPAQQDERQEESCEPTVSSKMNSVSEQFSGADKFGNKISGSRSATTMAQHSESIRTRHAPPTYADVVKGNIAVLDISADTSPEELLKNFQKTWQESERVFKSLGYKVSEVEEMTSQAISHQEVTENSSSRTGDVHTVSDEGLSDGVFNRRQTNLP
ncbi:xin actin-binding repeat-containing protein 2 isoform X1 [Lepisosteus oculatus]|uniref:xin actin-binding repeat-containing protein 2 isoform X1 n=2 Tax=Lepisosteus oculatus TaxID=7918 RepID=UPI0035F51708